MAYNGRVAGEMPKIPQFHGNAVALKFLTRLTARGSLPSTVLLTGPGGLGKALAGYLFVKALVCQKSQQDGYGAHGLEACNECAHCKALETGNSSDFVGIRPKTAKLTLKHVREEHNSFREAYLYPGQLPYRFFLLEECHVMSEDLSNTMLKLLEEPPEHTLFILVTDKPSLLLPTILSRSLRVRFLPESTESVEAWLRDQGVMETSAANAAFFSQGRPGLAKTLLTDDDLLPKLAGTMSRFAGVLRKQPDAPALVPLGEALLALADMVQGALVRVEEGDVPQKYYLLPWRRPRHATDDEASPPMTNERKRELGRDALQLVFDCLHLTMWRVESEGGPAYASAAAPLFGQATSFLDVNLREEQVVDYLLAKLPDARM
jgi:hypothetical protein